MNPTMSRVEGVPHTTALAFSIPNERRLSLPKALLVALLIEAGLIAAVAYVSTQSKKPPEKITQVTEFIPMSLPAPTPPKVETPPPEPVQPESPPPVAPPPPPEPPKPEPIKTEPPKPLPKSPIQEIPKPEPKPKPAPKPKPEPKPTHHEKPKPKPKKVEPPKAAPKPTPKPAPVVEKTPPVPAQPAKSAPAAPATTGVSSKATALNRTKPSYPRRALNAGIEGWVKLTFTVTAAGQVTNVHVVASAPPRLFDRAAVDAVKHWSFKPKMVDGKPVDGQVEQVIQFKLSDQ